MGYKLFDPNKETVLIFDNSALSVLLMNFPKNFKPNFYEDKYIGAYKDDNHNLYGKNYRDNWDNESRYEMAIGTPVFDHLSKIPNLKVKIPLGLMIEYGFNLSEDIEFGSDLKTFIQERRIAFDSIKKYDKNYTSPPSQIQQNPSEEQPTYTTEFKQKEPFKPNVGYQNYNTPPKSQVTSNEEPQLLPAELQKIIKTRRELSNRIESVKRMLSQVCTGIYNNFDILMPNENSTYYNKFLETLNKRDSSAFDFWKKNKSQFLDEVIKEHIKNGEFKDNNIIIATIDKGFRDIEGTFIVNPAYLLNGIYSGKDSLDIFNSKNIELHAPERGYTRIKSFSDLFTNKVDSSAPVEERWSGVVSYDEMANQIKKEKYFMHGLRGELEGSLFIYNNGDNTINMPEDKIFEFNHVNREQGTKFWTGNYSKNWTKNKTETDLDGR